jgi:hypothetical protein
MDNGATGDRVEVPAYYLAEWLTANWWPLFHEPLKADSDLESDGYRRRHWVGAARNGFALPDMWMRPDGEDLLVESFESYLPAARLTFGSAFLPRISTSSAKAAAANFVEKVVRRLKEKGRKTLLEESWLLIERTSEEQKEFCELMGALGLSPYEPNPEIEAALDNAVDSLPMQIVRDLCEAAYPEGFDAVVRMVSGTFSGLRSRGQQIDLAGLPTRPVEPNKKPWIWGERAAAEFRRTFGIQATDREAGARSLNNLGADAEAAATVEQDDGALEVEGAVERDKLVARMAVVRRKDIPQRRFATARGIFLAWGAGENDARLITRSHTREQQASRAFAAELLAPIDFIRRAAGSGPISEFRVKKIADELNVSAAVVAFQAQNHRLPLVGSLGG